MSALTGVSIMAAQTPIEAPDSCVVRERTYDSIDFECTPTVGRTGGRFHFTADFSGGHDDTLVTLEASTHAVPVACEAGSTTRLQGVDGDLRLACSIAIPFTVDKPARLVFRVRWSHAEFVGVGAGAGPTP